MKVVIRQTRAKQIQLRSVGAASPTRGRKVQLPLNEEEEEEEEEEVNLRPFL
jgi:hypothetical protein